MVTQRKLLTEPKFSHSEQPKKERVQIPPSFFSYFFVLSDRGDFFIIHFFLRFCHIFFTFFTRLCHISIRWLELGIRELGFLNINFLNGKKSKKMGKI